MAVFTSTTHIGRKLPKFYRKVINVIDNYLTPSHLTYHILVEFSFSKIGSKKGRQCDILVMVENGFYLFELKNKPFTKISINGDWILPNGTISVNTVGTTKENPYHQAINTADTLKYWIQKRVGFANAKEADFVESNEFKIFPIVVIQSFQGVEADLERDNWADIVEDIEIQIAEVFRRKWWNNETISEKTMFNLINQLDLKDHSGEIVSTSRKPGRRNQTIPYLIEVLASSTQPLTSSKLKADAEFLANKNINRTYDRALNNAVKEGLIIKTEKGKFRLEPRVQHLITLHMDPVEIYSNYAEFDEIHVKHQNFPLIFDAYVEEHYEFDNLEQKVHSLSIQEFKNFGYYLKKYSINVVLKQNTEHDVYLFRSVKPRWKDLSEFISKTNMWQVLKNYLDWEFPDDHLIINGDAGTGKTIIAILIGFKYYLSGVPVFLFANNELNSNVLNDLADFLSDNSENALVIFEDIHLTSRSYLAMIRRVIDLSKKYDLSIILTSRSIELAKSLISNKSDQEDMIRKIDLSILQLEETIIQAIATSMLQKLFGEALPTIRGQQHELLINELLNSAGYNYYFLKILLASIFYQIDPEFIDDYQINIGRIKDEKIDKDQQIEVLNLITKSTHNIQPVKTDFIISRLEQIINKISSETGFAPILIRRVMISCWVLGALELSITPYHISGYWDLKNEDIELILAELRNQGEIVDEDAKYKLQHSLQGKIFLSITKKIRKWQDIYYEFDLETSDGNFIELYSKKAAEFDVNFILSSSIDHYEAIEDQPMIDNIEKYLEISENLSLGDLLDIFWHHESRLNLSTPSQSIWEMYDPYILAQLILEEEEIEIVLEFIKLLQKLNYSLLLDMLDAVGTSYFCEMLIQEDLRYIIDQLLSNLYLANWLEFPFLVNELFLTAIKKEENLDYSFYLLAEYPNFIELNDPEVLLRMFEKNHNILYKLSHINESFGNLQIKLIKHGTNKGPSVYSLPLLSGIMATLTRSNIIGDNEKTQIIKTIENWDNQLLVQNLENLTVYQFWDFLIILSGISKSKLSSLLNLVDFDLIEYNLHDYQFMFELFNHLDFLFKINYPLASQLLDNISEEEIFDHIFRNEYTTIGNLKFLIDNNWKGIPQLLSLLPDDWIAYAENRFHDIQLLEILFKINYKNTDPIISYILNETIQDQLYKLEEKLSFMEENNINWSFLIETSVIDNIIEDLSSNQREKLLEIFNKYKWSYVTTIESKIDKVLQTRELKNQKSREMLEIKRIQDQIQKINKSIDIEIKKIENHLELGKALYHLRYRDIENGIKHLKAFLKTNLEEVTLLQLLQTLYREIGTQSKTHVLNLLQAEQAIILLKNDEYYERKDIIELLFELNRSHCLDVIMVMQAREHYLRNPKQPHYLYVNFFYILKEERLNKNELEKFVDYFIRHKRFDLVKRLPFEEQQSEILNEKFEFIKSTIENSNFSQNTWSDIFHLLSKEQANEIVKCLFQQKRYHQLLKIVKTNRRSSNKFRLEIIRSIESNLVSLFILPSEDVEDEKVAPEIEDPKMCINILSFLKSKASLLDQICNKEKRNLKIWNKMLSKADPREKILLEEFSKVYLN